MTEKSASDVLREKLTERDVSYIGDIASRDGVRTTHWKNDCNIVFQAIDFGMDDLLIQVVLTPEQAIAATLGSEREKALEELVQDWQVLYENRDLGDCVRLRKRMQKLGIEVIDE